MAGMAGLFFLGVFAFTLWVIVASLRPQLARILAMLEDVAAANDNQEVAASPVRVRQPMALLPLAA